MVEVIRSTSLKVFRIESFHYILGFHLLDMCSHALLLFFDLRDCLLRAVLQINSASKLVQFPKCSFILILNKYIILRFLFVSFPFNALPHIDSQVLLIYPSLINYLLKLLIYSLKTRLLLLTVQFVRIIFMFI